MASIWKQMFFLFFLHIAYKLYKHVNIYPISFCMWQEIISQYMEIQINMYCHLSIAFNKWKSPQTLQVNCICQLGRKTNLSMGGIQVIVLGDFYQLRLVPNKWVQDPGHYCFKSSICKHLIPHNFLLQEVHRQHDTIFIKAVSETARGAPSRETSEFIVWTVWNQERHIYFLAV